ncbi:hypothetical protein [Haliscomenobacter sp.]|uniref:hypothetical protein n=1 Tax=Haliscomenobacter sp. TaxID=2717303 RepID=UPI00359457E1
MNKIKIINAFVVAVLSVGIAACTNHQGMMHGNGTMYMTNWNWVLVVIGLGIVFLLGFSIARRKR